MLHDAVEGFLKAGTEDDFLLHVGGVELQPSLYIIEDVDVVEFCFRVRDRLEVTRVMNYTDGCVGPTFTSSSAPSNMPLTSSIQGTMRLKVSAGIVTMLSPATFMALSAILSISHVFLTVFRGASTDR